MTAAERDRRDGKLFLKDALKAAHKRIAGGGDPNTSTYFMAVFVTLAAGALYPSEPPPEET